jgi:putative transposase
VNHKRVERLYREEKLMLKRRRRKGVAHARVPAPLPARLNERWSMDFMSDALADGRKLRLFNVVDDFSREALAMEVDTSITALRVTRVLDRIARERGGYPNAIVMDNGPEFTSRELDQWAHRHGVRLDFIDRGKPVQNCFVESFNGRVREECLDLHWFIDLDDARRTMASWKREYNEERGHGSLGKMTPSAFAKRARDRAMETAENADSAFPSVPTAPAADGNELQSIVRESEEPRAENNLAELTL